MSFQSTLKVRVAHARRRSAPSHYNDSVSALLKYLKQQGFDSAGMLLHPHNFTIIHSSKKETCCNVCHKTIHLGQLRYQRRFPTFYMPSDAFNQYGYYSFHVCSLDCLKSFLTQWEAAKLKLPKMCELTFCTLIAGVAAQNDEKLFSKIFERWQCSENRRTEMQP